MKGLTFIMVLLLLSACASNPGKLTKKGLKIKIIKTYKPDPKCETQGRVVGKNDEGSMELATNHARNLAADMDANYIFVNDEVDNGSKKEVHATAYICP